MAKRKRSGSWSKGDESGAKKSDDCDSQEELEGDSSTPKTSVINVRCSARVQEKQEKLRREASPSKQCPSSESACPTTSSLGTGSSSSTNSMCKGKAVPGSTGDDPGVPFLVPDPTTPCGSSGGTKNDNNGEIDGKRKKRTWELWSQYDKQLFFEALNEFGKDFDAIQTHLASKLKSKTKTVEPTQIKKKEQVRHFYYRTWNKIQKYLHFPKDMKKAFQELYGLVNYGELRKKQRSLNGKTAAKLLELVEKGSTTIKVKGKTLRIKTPVCQALKKINNLTDVEPTKVPTKVVVELLPKDGAAWSVVQSLSHNPRVRSFVALQRTLASIITYLEERWKSSQDRIKEQMMAAFGKSSIRRLRLIPASRRDSTVPVFKAYETASSAKISLNAFSRNVLNKDTKDGYVKLIENRKRKKSGSVGAGGVEGATDSVAEVDWSDAEMYSETKDGGCGGVGGSACGANAGTGSYSSLATQLFRNAFGDNTLEVKGMPDDEVQRMLQSIYDLPRVNSQEEEGEEELLNGDGDVCPDSDDYQAAVSSKAGNTTGSGGCFCSHPKDDEKTVVGGGGTEPEEVFSTGIEDEVLCRGWTAEEAGSLTVGEVYMLVGHDEKLSFEYEWVEADDYDNEANKRTRIMLDRLIAVARNLKKKKQSRHKISGTSSVSSNAACCPSCGHNILSSAASGTPSLIPITGTVEQNSVTAASAMPVGGGVTIVTRAPHSPGMPNTKLNSAPHVPIVPVHHQPVSLSPSTASTVPTIFETSFDTCTTSSTSSTTASTTILSALSQAPSSSSAEIMNEPQKIKKITPTLVSPSCTGTILASLPLVKQKPDVIQIPLSSNTLQKEVTANATATVIKPEDNFRVPSNINNNNNSSPIYPRIRPMPTVAGSSDHLEESSSSGNTNNNKNVKNAPKPFLDLPKGNRRLGRPCCKKNIVPRYLPLLPKKVEPVAQPAAAVWEIVGNKPAVHTVYVSSAAQLMLPVTGMGMKSSAVGSPALVTSSSPITTTATPPLNSGCEKDEIIRISTSTAAALVEASTAGPINNPLGSTTTNPPAAAETPGLLGVENSAGVGGGDDGSCPNFKDLLKVSGLEGDKTESNLSLSSFMDISLPESTRNVANECLKSEKFLDVTLGSSSCSLSLSNFLGQGDGSSQNAGSCGVREGSEREETLKTPQKVGQLELYRNQSPPSNLLSTENQWLTSDGNDLSLGSLLGNLEPAQSVVTSENDMNFQSMMIEDSNNHLDFTSKFSELVAELESSNNNKK